MVSVPGGEIFVRRWHVSGGRCETPVVLLHDSLGCVELWRDFPEVLALKLGRQVVAYDRLGFGRSTERTAPPSLRFIDEEAESVFPALCASLGLEKVIPFGHSVGGCMAIAIASIHSMTGLCAAVITDSSQPYVEERTKRGIIASRNYFNQGNNFEKLAKYHGPKARWVLQAWTDTWLHPQFLCWNLKTHLNNVHCPILAVHGDRDEYGSVDFPEFIAGQATGYSRSVVLPGIGHVPHKESCAEILDMVSGFLAESVEEGAL